MALTPAQKALCEAWVTSPNRTWQVLNRSQWKYQFREKTLVRYVEEAKMDEDIVPLLLEYLTSPDCKDTLQLYGQEVGAEWTPTRAWYEISNKAVGSVRAVRLYHGIAIEPTDGEDGPYLVEDGCAYKVSWTYYWKRVEAPTVPASTSGISYRVANLQRDPDTGLYSYTIEKRERVQQDIEEYLMKTTQYEDVSEEVHLGVRGDESLGGRQASVANGKTVTRKVTKNQDCTHDVHNTITQDKAVPESSVTVAVGVRGTSVTTENRNMPAPASTDGLGPGESVRNQKTDSKLWNQTIRRFLRESLTWLRESCRKTIFAHTHSETVNVKDKPSFDHVVEASGGHIVEKSVHKTEEGFDVTEQTTDELPVSDAVRSVHVGVGGTTHSVTHRNQPAPAPDPTEVGKTVTNEKTQGGLWNITIRERVRGALRRIADGCAKTIFMHRHSSSRVQSSDPGFSHVDDAGGGNIRQAHVTETEEGFRVDESVTKELPVRDAVVSERMTLTGLSRSVLHRNQPAPLPTPTEIGKGVTNRKTEGGLFDVTEIQDGLDGAGRTGEGCSRDAFTHHHTVTENSKDPVDPETEFTPGKIVRKSTSKTGNGTSNNTTDVTTAIPERNEYDYTRADGAKVHVIQYRNQPETPSYPNGADGLSVHDNLNAFKLHDGSISWLTNVPYKWVAGDLKFIKHGRSVTFWQVGYSKRFRKFRHRSWTVQVHHIRGDAYTDYLSDEMRADANRTTNGVMMTRLISTWRDRDGNLLAEWKWVGLETPGENWVVCTQQCKHDLKEATWDDIRKAARDLMSGSAAAFSQEDQQKERIQSSRENALLLAAALRGQAPELIREQWDAAVRERAANRRKEAES